MRWHGAPPPLPTGCSVVAEGPLGRAATVGLLEKHGIRTRRSLGQHFLVDPNIVRRIVAAAGVGPGDNVLEIGAGAGTLTRGLAATGARVVAYEIDGRLRPLLDEALEGLAAVEVRYADAGGIGPGSIDDGDWVMVANLPYNVGTPLLLRLIREEPRLVRFVVMLQREAVERLAASPGTRAYGLPSVVVQLHGRVEVAFKVPATVFVPSPPVESAVAVIRRTPAHPLTDLALSLAAAAFGQRRKMLRRSLASVVADPEKVVLGAGLDPTSRAEELLPGDYLRLAEVADAG
jgi:16S rRNA (adenine1518-N6/adenine1519-N6)-dimethyltransferase